MHEISVKKTKDHASCNCCRNVRNYTPTIVFDGEKVETLFDVSIGSQTVCLCKDCLQLLHNAVSLEIGVDVAPVVHGYWEEYSTRYSTIKRYRCSICKKDAEEITDGGGWELLSEYCPHCGARMDGEADG